MLSTQDRHLISKGRQQRRMHILVELVLEHKHLQLTFATHDLNTIKLLNMNQLIANSSSTSSSAENPQSP